MKLILYTNETKVAGKRLRNVIESQISNENLEIYSDFDFFSSRLRRLPLYDLNFAVLLASTREELSRLFSIKEFFKDIRVILILPDNEKETISKGHKFYPRFVSYKNGDFKDVAAVLEKMMDHENESFKL